MGKKVPTKLHKASPDTMPCFYKIMLPHNLIDLPIPPKFKKHLPIEKTDRATLKSPCGSWDVKVLQDENGDVYFTDGWQDFVKHHSLGKLEFLTFKQNRAMSFDVAIFDMNGCLRDYPPVESYRDQESSSSSFPFFEKKMTAYNIGSKSTMLIPSEFSERHLRLKRHTIILRNSDGVYWSARIIVTNKNSLSISAGWKAFADDNSIKKGDVCVFTLVDKNTIEVRKINIRRC